MRWIGLFLVVLISCSPTPTTGKKTLVVTYSVLGSLVKDLVGDEFQVVVAIPNGLDPHEWEPSARDIETLNHAALLVRNGLNLEAGMEKTLQRAVESGIPAFTAADHLATRPLDPHVWLDPLRMKTVMLALADDLKRRFGADLATRATDLARRLEALNAQLREEVDQLPLEMRLLVTGHESMGYFADAYGFTLMGAIIPSLTTAAEVSASDLATLKKLLGHSSVRVIFSELGTPPKVAQTLANELHLRVAQLTTDVLPADSSYFTLMRNLGETIFTQLRE